MLKNEFVCATADGNMWYYFNGSLWKEDRERVLGVQCLERKRVGNTLLRSVYDGYILKERDYIDE